MPKRTERAFWFLILGCVVVTFFPNFVNSVEKAKERTAKINLTLLQQAEERYYAEKGEYLAVETPAEIIQHLNLPLKEAFWDFKVVVPQKNKYIITAVRKSGPFASRRLEVRS